MDAKKSKKQGEHLIDPKDAGFDSYDLEKYADVLLWGLDVARKKTLRKSDLILVRYDLAALPLAEVVAEKLHGAGRIPVIRAESSDKMEHDFLEMANNKRLTFEIPGERELCQALAGSIRLLAPQDLENLADIDPDQIRLRAYAREQLQEILRRREQSGDFGWTLGVYPTRGPASLAGMDLLEYAAHVRRACLLDKGTPVTDWKLLRKRMQETLDWLNGMDIQTLRVQSDNMDLLLRPGERRKWVGLSGRNIPSFEIYVSPDWRGTEGTYYADQPTYRGGTRIQGVQLEFRCGEAVRVVAKEGQDMAREQAALDKNANKLGEFALVDKRFSPIKAFMANTLFDENYGGEYGSCHVALGQSYSNTLAFDPSELSPYLRQQLGLNSSVLHWDMVNTEDKRVMAKLADGTRTCIYENGEFTC